ncbi:MAG: peptidylprolyl isomerase [Candidatus Neomarinimicrobiota bacterium]
MTDTETTRSKRTRLAVLFLFVSSSFLCGQETIDGIAAIVGDNIVLKSELAELVFRSALELKLDPQRDTDRLSKLQKQVLESMIDQKLMLEMAEIETVEVNDREVDAALDQYLESLVAQYGSEARVAELMGKSVTEMRRELWPDMHDQLISQRFQEELLSDVAVTRNEVVTFYDEYRDSLQALPTLYDISHILFGFAPGEESRQAAYDYIRSIRRRVLTGEDFAALAREYSQDPGSSPHGGELGLVSRGTLVPEFEELAFSLEPDETSAIIKTGFGYHIVQLVNKVGEKINVRHILISPQMSDADEDSVYSAALSIRDSIVSGNDFSTFAQRYSAHELSRLQGGNLGWVSPSTLPVPEMAEALPILTVGDISVPIRSNDGYHLLLLQGIKVGGFPALSSHWSEIETLALAKKKSDFFSDWIEKASSSLYIKTFIQ